MFLRTYIFTGAFTDFVICIDILLDLMEVGSLRLFLSFGIQSNQELHLQIF